MICLAKHSLFILIFLLLKIFATVAQAQILNDKEKIKIKNNLLWADSIEYDRKEKKILASGRVRLFIQNEDGIDTLFSDSITYDEQSGVIRAEGGKFNIQEGSEKINNNSQAGRGLLRWQSKYFIFFQNIEIDKNINYLKGENISLRQLNINGGFTARNFEIKKRKNKKEDWIFYRARYTKCPICADKMAEVEAKKQKKNRNKKTKKKSKFAPLWRIDASKVRFENFSKENEQNLKPSARVHMYNARMNIYGMPILYSPYFSYPRYGQRASGFLAPTYSFGGVNGYSISTPVFWAPHKNFDVTYIPKFTTTSKDTSRIELRSAFAFGVIEKQTQEKQTQAKQAQEGKKLSVESNRYQSEEGEKTHEKSKQTKGSKHILSFTTGASIPHSEIGSGRQAKFLAYAKGSWLAPKGLRANAQYHFIGERNYLYNYAQGVDILSTEAPTKLDDLLEIEYFSRNGYANISLQQQRELYDNPRADARLLPEILYENAGTFASNKRGNAKWAVNALWRGAVRDKQQTLEQVAIDASPELRQDLFNSSLILGWQRYLGAGFTSNADAKVAINYRQQKLGAEESKQWQILPEIQLGIQGLFANTYNNGARILYLKPMLEVYSTLENIERGSLEQLDGRVEFYDQQERIGQRMPFDTTLDGGQRLLSALELGVKGAKGSSFSMLVAPSVKWQNDNSGKQTQVKKTSGNMNLEAKGSWKSYLSFAYDTKWSIPEFSLASQKALVVAKYGVGSVSLAYKELYGDSDQQETRIAYDKSLTLVGGINAFKKWRTSLTLGYNFLRTERPFNNIAFVLAYDGSCADFKLSYDRYFYSDRQDDDSINLSFGLNF